MAHKRILVVDDDDAICTIVQATLEEEGYDVAAAVGTEALELAAKQPPDLILLDLVMPAMDGRELRNRLLTNPRTARVPVVVMSSEERAQVVAREMKAQGCLPKPFRIDDLVHVVEQQAGIA